MVLFIPGGPSRFAHQKRGLQKLIKTGGVTALLFEPGLGKTAVILDYASLLALKSPTGEARVLVVCPLVAVDTWVSQARMFVSPQVGFWAEALGSGILKRCEALASRGGNPYSAPLSTGRPKPPKGWILVRDDVWDTRGRHEAQCLRCPENRIAKQAATVDRWWQQHLIDCHPEYRPPVPKHHSRALHYGRAIALDFRHPQDSQTSESQVPPSGSMGPEGVGTPRLVLIVTNFDTFASRTEHGNSTMADVVLGAVKRFNPDMVVVDESHKIKGRSNTSRLMARISEHVQRRAILTGTVAPTGPIDIFHQWRFLEPYAFGEEMLEGTRKKAVFHKFLEKYVIYGGWANKEIKGYMNLDHMQEVMRRNAIVCRKVDALDLPPTTEVEIPVHLSPAEMDAYKEMKNTLVAQLANGAFASVPNRLVQMLRLRQITSGYLPEDKGPTQVIGTSKVDVICSLIQDTLIGERRIVVFCVFSQEIRTLAERLEKDSSIQVMVIEGSTSTAERLRFRSLFGSDDPSRIVLIAQIRTISLAVNELVTASHAIFASLSQQRDDLEQAKARLDRQGQTRPVTFWFAIAPDTVDEVVLRSHRERTDLENALLRHINDNAS